VTPLFRLSNLLVLPFWALMILLPRWRWTGRVMRSPFISAAPAIVYAALVIPRVSTIWPAVARPTLTGVAVLLGSPEGATIAWVHFLAFDLFIGRWIYLDSQERRLRALLMAPILFLTLMLGPLGFLAYLLLRAVATSRQADRGNTDVPLASDMSAAPRTGAQLGSRTRVSDKTVLQRAWIANRPLTILGVAMILVFFGTLVGILFDHRIINQPSSPFLSACIASPLYGCWGREAPSSRVLRRVRPSRRDSGQVVGFSQAIGQSLLARLSGAICRRGTTFQVARHLEIISTTPSVGLEGRRLQPIQSRRIHRRFRAIPVIAVLHS
jgi:hypothetical protein